MNRYLRIGATVVALLVALAVVGNARAAFVTSGDTITGTLGDWVDAGYVQQQDKLWTYVTSSDLDLATSITFTVDALADGTYIHTLSIGGIDYTESGATLDYTISITTPNNNGLNNFVFQSATLDTTTVGVGSTAIKALYADSETPFLTLTSTDGSAATSAITGDLTTLYIAESWTVESNGYINQTFNTFTEGAIPEPLSIGVWTLLLACVGVSVTLRRRHKA
ncbi:MAG: hypothetical protein ABFC63_03370 [Thermoguttaceae bacterium]